MTDEKKIAAFSGRLASLWEQAEKIYNAVRQPTTEELMFKMAEGIGKYEHERNEARHERNLMKGRWRRAMRRARHERSLREAQASTAVNQSSALERQALMLRGRLEQFEPKWTSEAPVEPGWYWVRYANSGSVVVAILDKGQMFVGGIASYKSAFDLFAGPLKAPQTKEEKRAAALALADIEKAS